jgi:signal peptidase II
MNKYINFGNYYVFMKKLFNSTYKYLFYLPLVIIIFDQLTKYLITHFMQLHQSIPIIKNIFHLTYVSNTGTLFGMFQNANSIFIWLMLITIGAILYFYDKFDKNEAIVFALVVGAAIGNLIDRLFHGFVIDFLDFKIWPVFNVADIVVSCSVVFLLIYMFLKRD